MKNEIYNESFYDEQREKSHQSANASICYINDIYMQYMGKNWSSVVDFGCGTGSWLAAFSYENSNAVINGFDWGEMSEHQYYISPDLIKKVDLSKEVITDRKYDICISLEVAEHLSESCADRMVGNLCEASDFIVFSAAVPGQGGKSHINEKPQSYWKEKFNKRGYLAIDSFREKAWNNERIEVWYRQNVIVYIKNDAIVENMRKEAISRDIKMITDIIHPSLFYRDNQELALLKKQLENHIISGVYLEKHVPFISRIIKLLRYRRF